MDLGPLVLITGAALLAPVIAHLTRGLIPVVVGQTMLGVALGTTGIGAVDPTADGMPLLATLGFATLMFTVGMHVPLHDRRLRGAARGGLTAAALSVPVALAAGWAIEAAVGGPGAVYAVLIASSSAAIALPLIDERHLDGGSILRAMVWIVAADIIAMVAVPLALDPDRAPRALLGALAIAAIGAAVLLIAIWGRRTGTFHALRHEGKRRDWAIDLRAAVFVLVALSFVAEHVGTSLLIAGFGTGLVVGAIGGPKRLSREVLGLGQGFLIPVFFVLLGARIDLTELGGDPRGFGIAALLAIGTICSHVLVARMIGIRALMGVIASAQVGVPAAIIAIGLQSGDLDQLQASAIFAAALVTIVACGIAARLVPPVKRHPPQEEPGPA